MRRRDVAGVRPVHEREVSRLLLAQLHARGAFVITSGAMADVKRPDGFADWKGERSSDPMTDAAAGERRMLAAPPSCYRHTGPRLTRATGTEADFEVCGCGLRWTQIVEVATGKRFCYACLAEKIRRDVPQGTR